MRAAAVFSGLSTLLLVLASCSSPAQVEVSCDAFLENPHIAYEIAVSAGDEFKVTLCSNQSTGYAWSEDAQIADTNIVRQVNHEFLSATELETPPLPGTPGLQEWTFKALAQGRTDINFDYSRPWEGGEQSTWTFKVMATIE